MEKNIETDYPEAKILEENGKKIMRMTRNGRDLGLVLTDKDDPYFIASRMYFLMNEWDEMLKNGN